MCVSREISGVLHLQIIEVFIQIMRVNKYWCKKKRRRKRKKGGRKGDDMMKEGIEEDRERREGGGGKNFIYCFENGTFCVIFTKVITCVVHQCLDLIATNHSQAPHIFKIWDWVEGKSLLSQVVCLQWNHLFYLDCYLNASWRSSWSTLMTYWRSRNTYMVLSPAFSCSIEFLEFFREFRLTHSIVHISFYSKLVSTEPKASFILS